MKVRTILASLAIVLLGTGVAFAAARFSVRSGEFDPAHTFLVQAQWLDGIGCATNGRMSTDGSTTTTFNDTGCPTGDTSDQHNQGLLLAKTGPTANFAAAVAELTGVDGISLTELGYDIRKAAGAASAMGSHCGAGAPRFDVITTDGTDHFLGCNSPAATVTASSTGWLRLRWNAAGLAAAFPAILATDKVKSITIVFDEGQDTGPDFFGLAVLDNIDVNGTLVGSGDNKANKKGDKDRNGKDDDDTGNDRGDNSDD